MSIRTAAAVIWSLCLAGSLNCSGLAFAQDQSQDQTEVPVATGSITGVYNAFAEDIETFLASEDIDIDPLPTAGSAQNLDSLHLYDVPLAFSQVDVLAYLSSFGSDNPQIQTFVESLDLVLPLYQEEVYVVARADLESFADLEDAVVAVGPDGSGTAMTAKILLLDAGVVPARLVNLSSENAIAALRAEEIDAFFTVVGTPSPLLAEGINESSDFHLLPVSIRSLPDDEFFSTFYTSTTIPADTYPWQSEAIDTLSVQAALWTTQGESCDQVGPVADLIIENLEWFQENGHPEWESVSFEDEAFTPFADRLSPCLP